jgi:hypothetical protein
VHSVAPRITVRAVDGRVSAQSWDGALPLVLSQNKGHGSEYPLLAVRGDRKRSNRQTDAQRRHNRKFPSEAVLRQRSALGFSALDENESASKTYRTLRSCTCVREVGTFPVSRLLFKSRVCSRYKRPISAGTEPIWWGRDQILHTQTAGGKQVQVVQLGQRN